MQRDDVVLYADGGDMTVGRRTGVYSYGNFQVILPEGQEQQESDGRLQEGYISRPTTDRPRGRFDIGFVRADASIDIGAGISDLESVIDSAQKRVEGDVFFERDIYGRGLGRYRLGVDFDVGDIVQVQIWGRRLSSPVTSGDMVVSGSDGTRGQRVHVGGQMISDPQALRRHNDDLLQQIVREKRDRIQADGVVRGVADGAQESSDNLTEDLTGDVDKRPSEAVDQGTGVLGELAKLADAAGGQSQTLTDQFTELVGWATADGYVDPASELSPILQNQDAINQQRQEFEEEQEKTDAWQTAMITQNQRAIEAADAARPIPMVGNGDARGMDGDVYARVNGDTINVTGSWIGRIMTFRWTSDGGLLGPDAAFSMDFMDVTASARGPFVQAGLRGLLIFREPGEAKTWSRTTNYNPRPEIPTGQWVKIGPGFTAPIEGDYVVTVTVRWQETGYLNLGLGSSSVSAGAGADTRVSPSSYSSRSFATGLIVDPIHTHVFTSNMHYRAGDVVRSFVWADAAYIHEVDSLAMDISWVESGAG